MTTPPIRLSLFLVILFIDNSYASCGSFTLPNSKFFGAGCNGLTVGGTCTVTGCNDGWKQNTAGGISTCQASGEWTRLPTENHCWPSKDVTSTTWVEAGSSQFTKGTEVTLGEVVTIGTKVYLPEGLLDDVTITLNCHEVAGEDMFRFVSASVEALGSKVTLDNGETAPVDITTTEPTPASSDPVGLINITLYNVLNTIDFVRDEGDSITLHIVVKVREGFAFMKGGMDLPMNVMLPGDDGDLPTVALYLYDILNTSIYWSSIAATPDPTVTIGEELTWDVKLRLRVPDIHNKRFGKVQVKVEYPRFYSPTSARLRSGVPIGSTDLGCTRTGLESYLCNIDIGPIISEFTLQWVFPGWAQDSPSITNLFTSPFRAYAHLVDEEAWSTETVLPLVIKLPDLINYELYNDQQEDVVPDDLVFFGSRMTHSNDSGIAAVNMSLSFSSESSMTVHNATLFGCLLPYVSNETDVFVACNGQPSPFTEVKFGVGDTDVSAKLPDLEMGYTLFYALQYIVGVIELPKANLGVNVSLAYASIGDVTGDECPGRYIDNLLEDAAIPAFPNITVWDAGNSTEPETFPPEYTVGEQFSLVINIEMPPVSLFGDTFVHLRDYIHQTWPQRVFRFLGADIDHIGSAVNAPMLNMSTNMSDFYFEDTRRYRQELRIPLQGTTRVSGSIPAIDKTIRLILHLRIIDTRYINLRRNQYQRLPIRIMWDPRAYPIIYDVQNVEPYLYTRLSTPTRFYDGMDIIPVKIKIYHYPKSTFHARNIRHYYGWNGNELELAPTTTTSSTTTQTFSTTTSFTGNTTTIASTIAPERSAINCASVRWRNVGCICAESDKWPGGCAGPKNHSGAQAFCRSVGARLCTVKELKTNVALGTGCGLDDVYVWTGTSEGCPAGQSWMSSGRAYRLADKCASNSANSGVRCCADRGPAGPDVLKCAWPRVTGNWVDNAPLGSVTEDTVYVRVKEGLVPYERLDILIVTVYSNMYDEEYARVYKGTGHNSYAYHRTYPYIKLPSSTMVRLNSSVPETVDWISTTHEDTTFQYQITIPELRIPKSYVLFQPNKGMTILSVQVVSVSPNLIPKSNNITGIMAQGTNVGFMQSNGHYRINFDNLYNVADNVGGDKILINIHTILEDNSYTRNGRRLILYGEFWQYTNPKRMSRVWNVS